MTNPTTVPNTTEEPIESELSALVDEGRRLLDGIMDTKAGDVLPFTKQYQAWYTRGLAVVKALIPERLQEFRGQYERDLKRRTVDAVTYTIQDFTQGVQALKSSHALVQEPAFDVNMACYVKFNSQIEILASSASRLHDILADLRGLLQADLFDSELQAARHLLRGGHLRAAGAVAGVVLEGHLSEISLRHVVAVAKRDPHISDYNDALKTAGILDLPNWRWIQRLADIRNLCDHKKQRDPTRDEVTELLDGVDKAIKTLT